MALQDEPLLELKAVHHAIGGRTIVEIEHWALRPGEHALLLGPSGSGKTSLINIVCGLVAPTGGEVRVAGERMTGVSALEKDDLRRRRIGLVFQTLRLVSALTVRQNLLLAQTIGRRLRDEADVDRLIGRVGLSHRAHGRPRELSQGEGQRAAIARALVARPALVIADEPTSALDDANTGRMLDLLFDSAAATGATLLVATHDERVRGRFAHRLELAARA
ncbi:ATP-binding cassette domain-containing protein [Sandaracinobacter sp. RS1-74]|uniref:ABC transporter ATP-binding protein n=1 Tax=Sandaracinobacteroides sayramensis TaxID=2913411 RepID=UPI001EDAB484|nr:ATP-binding cassette domain-containing protein [Sandaracinobacteroides sayramensis]MCG2842055.1 ATP-binding cassette domain-containing protein [Sandaracinobacteroides sayramensis]